jgi:hypothetical protein
MAATPTEADAVAAVVDAIGDMTSAPDVVEGFPHHEDDVAFIRKGGYLSSGSMDLCMVHSVAAPGVEGPATGEAYQIYNVVIRYWSVRTGKDQGEWATEAAAVAEAIIDELHDNDDVFAIDGQQQLHTPTTVSKTVSRAEDIRGTEGPQRLWLIELTLSIEARRWA